MSNNVKRPVYAVIGATGGIGAALSRRLAESGAGLLLGSRNEEKLAPLASELEVGYRVLDARDFGETEAFVAEAAAMDGEFRGIANCAGSVVLRPAHLTAREELQGVFDDNLTTAFSTVRAAVRHLKDRAGSAVEGCGSIVLVSSAAATVGLPQHEAIAAAKAAVAALARTAAASYASWGIRVNAVAPGMVHTPATDRIVSNEGSLKASLAYHALQRVGKPEEVASLIAWLLGPESGWVTGQVWGIDGGLSGTKISRPR